MTDPIIELVAENDKQVLHIRGDQMRATLEIVAAAREWRVVRRLISSSHLEIVRAATRLERTVEAYEALLPQGAGDGG